MDRSKLLSLACSLVPLLLTTQAGATVNFLSTPESTSWSHIVGFRPQLAGRDLNGVSLNGEVLDGRVVELVSLDGATIAGKELGDMWVEAGQLAGRDSRGRPVKRDGFVGAELLATLDDGSLLPLTIAAAERHPDRENRDVWGYEVWYAAYDQWAPLCGLDDDGIPVMAIPLSGRWSYAAGEPDGGSHIDDPSVFTFGCESHVLAKCVLAGYHPWQEGLVCAKGSGCHKVSLAPLHQACTRALRADYCGDGTSHTVDGTVINLYDGFEVRLDTESWEIESLWDEHGALCLGEPRVAGDAAIECSEPLTLSPCSAAAMEEDPFVLATETQ